MNDGSHVTPTPESLRARLAFCNNRNQVISDRLRTVYEPRNLQGRNG